ncbi:MAG: hypothetical protein ABIJ12_07425 [bacterium]
MAKKQSFADKANKKTGGKICPVCSTDMIFVKHVKAEKSETGWRYRTVNVGVCKCNEAEVYA